MKVVPVVLSGGSGTRLWPLSRELYPKQFLPLTGAQSLYQQTLMRVRDAETFLPPTVVCNEDHRFLVAQQAHEAIGRAPRILLEPVARNTAPAIALAALDVAETDPDQLMLVLPADHVIAEPDRFREAVETGAQAATNGHIVTFGVIPGAPETGYGYILPGETLGSGATASTVSRFIEKPSRVDAERLIGEGCLWNAGIFLFRAGDVLAQLETLQPDLVAACRAALAGRRDDLDFLRVDGEKFAAAPSISFDHAVMERTDRAAVVSVAMGWTDLGSWSALWEISERDAAGNSAPDSAYLVDAERCFVHSDGAIVAAIGTQDLIIVATDDAILVADRARVQDVKTVVERIKTDGLEVAASHTRVYRPWGYYQSINQGERFQVKRLHVSPGQTLSLQKHFHRAEHWVVVNGTALVTSDDREVMVSENESIYLPAGTVHRLANPGRIPLNVIEVQSGAYLGEDDIVRFEDTYGRVPAALPGRAGQQ